MDRIPTEELKHVYKVTFVTIKSVPMDRIPTEELKHEQDREQ